MRTILTTAYAINPFKGSEDGMGWNHILQIAKYSNVIAITRQNNLPAIQKYMIENKLTNLNVEFHGYDLPYWMRFWKRGQNGAMAYFYLWQFFMPIYILLKKFNFDIAHNLNFHTDWIPTFLWVFRKPVVWGPVGHHPKVPTNYYHRENTKWIDRLKNHLIWFTKKIFWNIDPFFYLAKLNVDTILCFSKEVAHQMKANLDKVEYMYSVGSEETNYKKTMKSKFKVLSVGRLVPLKGFDITIRSFHHFLNNLTLQERKNVELVLVGKGTMYPELVKYVKKYDLSNNVKIIDWMKRDHLKKHYDTSSLFFFPSHEGAGMVIPEALSFGVPTLCFDNNGPGLFINDSCGLKIPYSTYEQSIVEFSEMLTILFHDIEFSQVLGDGARKEFENSFLWDAKAERFEAIYQKILNKKDAVPANQLIHEES